MKIDQIDDVLKEYEKILGINGILIKSEEQIKSIRDTIDDVEEDINKREIKDLNTKSEITSLQEEIEKMIKINSKLSHDIKRNDIAFSHMVKNFDGRKSFLNTIELNINQAESYGKRLQIEFEREYETVGLCEDILSVSEKEKCKEKSERVDTNIVSSSESCQSKNVTASSEGYSINSVFANEFLNTGFTVSATQNPFGI